VTLEADVLAAFPAEVHIPAQLVADAVAASSGEAPRILVVLDDDPTGTQSVSDLAVLTRWEVADFTWAFTHIRENQTKPAVYVLTNTRSLDPSEAAARNEEIVRNALAAAAGLSNRLGALLDGWSRRVGRRTVFAVSLAAYLASGTLWARTIGIGVFGSDQLIVSV